MGQKGDNFMSDSDQKKINMSDLFWQKLGEYVKEPSDEALSTMMRALRWARHEDRALANSFIHAMDWCGVNYQAEFDKHGWEA